MRWRRPARSPWSGSTGSGRVLPKVLQCKHHDTAAGYHAHTPRKTAVGPREPLAPAEGFLSVTEAVLHCRGLPMRDCDTGIDSQRKREYQMAYSDRVFRQAL